MEAEFDQIYNRSYQYLLKYVITKIDNLSNTEDVMQEIYVHIYKIINKKGIDYINNEKYFILKIARNELFKYYSLKNKLKNLCNYDMENISTALFSDTSQDTSLEVETKMEGEDIWSIIKKEPQDIQKILCLYYLGNTKINDIAILLGQNPNTIKTKLYRTVNKIRKEYGGVHNGENE